ncbi:MAG: CAP domain-containing protein [Candidatus Micrarchaeota archaeon]|nr:CAP domain-containing protein [Candidatus Micrarchaeota archaeon]
MPSPYLLAAATAAFIVLMVVLAVAVLPGAGLQGTATTSIAYGTSAPTTTVQQAYNTTTTVQQGGNPNATQLDYYVLSLINRDRAQYGLGSVTLSPEPSAQQHSASMLAYNYFSHWDPFGMKPYMRYTLLGGLGAASENVATNYSTICIGPICRGNLNVNASLASMEYDMMYNDQQCCNNGHRDNILDPNHNQVSIGIAYNSSRIYLTQDFIDSYIGWTDGPGYSNGEVVLEGNLQPGYAIDSVELTYDPAVQNMTREQLNATSEYGYGTTIAGVARGPLYYYQGIATIDADSYQTSGSSFAIRFNMSGMVRQYGAGEYTVLVWLNSTTNSTGFIGSTYTIFVDGSGAAYAPSNV